MDHGRQRRRSDGSSAVASPISRIRIAADVHHQTITTTDDDDDDSGCALDEYAWVPSGIKPDMVRFFGSQTGI